MNAFLKKCAIMILLVLAFCVGIELILLTKPNVYSYKIKYVENHLNDIAVLLLGNSHIEEALIPGIICDSCFNFAILATPYDVYVDLAERYIPKMDNLKIVVMPLSYQFFELGRHKNNDSKTPTERKKENNTYKCMQRKYLGIRRLGICYCSEILYSNEDFLGRLLIRNNTRDFCDSLGYVKLDAELRQRNWYELSVPGDFIPGVKRDDYSFDSLFKAHELVSRLCYKKGIRLVFVSAPVYKTYQDKINDVVINDIYALVDSLKTKYPNVEYYNLLYAEGFGSEDFYDAGHLSYSGARKFSKIFADSLFTNR